MATFIKTTMVIRLIVYEGKLKIIPMFLVCETRWRVIQFIEAKNIRKGPDRESGKSRNVCRIN